MGLLLVRDRPLVFATRKDWVPEGGLIHTHLEEFPLLGRAEDANEGKRCRAGCVACGVVMVVFLPLTLACECWGHSRGQPCPQTGMAPSVQSQRELRVLQERRAWDPGKVGPHLSEDEVLRSVFEFE